MCNSLVGWMKELIALSLIVSGLLLIGCGGGGSGGSSGGPGGPSLPAEVELSISPFDDGLRIQWQNLPGFERAGGIYLHLNLTSNDDPPMLIKRRVAIEDLTNSSYEVVGLTNGTAYRLVEVRVELAGNISQVIENIVWEWEENKEDNNDDGIVVGANHDMDWRANSVDRDDDNDMRPDGEDACRLGEIGWNSDNSTLDYDSDGCRNDEDWDNDNDGVNNTRADGTQWDLCRQGELDWMSDNTTDHDSDGCRDEGEDRDDDNDGVDDERDGIALDLCRQGELNWMSDSMNDYDGDGCRDRDEDWDNDNDGVNNTRADGTTVWDLCQRRALDWLSDSTNDFDGDGCRNDEDPDGDNDGIPNDNETASCELDTDCDNDGLDDGNEPIGCILDPNCDNDGLADGEDNCPVGLRGWRDNGTNDMDGDGCRNDEDIDDDGDGLIEIGTAEELDAVRHVLNGTGFKAHEMAMLNQSGCGDGVNISECSGYELVRDISLTDYIAETSPTEGWQPIAPDANPNTFLCEGDKFTAIFDGNGFEVRGLSINRSTENCIGLFGQVNGRILNLGVIADRIMGGGYVGSIVGDGTSAHIMQSYGMSDEVRGSSSRVGGLVGTGRFISIVESYAVSGVVNGSLWVGGLIGDGRSAKIIESYAISNEVKGRDRTSDSIGGLVGNGESSEIIRSYAISGVVSGLQLATGGLLGAGNIAKIIQSYAISNEVKGDNWVGGLVGWGQGAVIYQSYGVSSKVNGNNRVGGLVGNAGSSDVFHSYAVSGVVDGSNSVGGLVGFSGGAHNSYWDTEASGITDDGATGSTGFITSVLRSPTNYMGTIYTTWDIRPVASGNTVAGVGSDSFLWCDEDQSGVIEDGERRDNTHINGDNRVWDFGTTTDYPALRCTGDSLVEQRAWWHLNATGQPELNQTRLDAWLDGTLP